MEELTASRTLRAVIDTIEASLGSSSGNGSTAAGAPGGGGGERPFENGPAEEERIGRFVLQATSAPAIRATVDLAGEGAVVILDDGTGVGEALASVLAGEGHDVRRLPVEEHPLGEERARTLAEELRRAGGVKALVHLAALSADPPVYGAVDSLLVLAAALGQDLETAAAAGGAAVLGATRLGGDFGVRPDAADSEAVPAGLEAGSFEQGAIPGFLKTLAGEWPQVRTKARDLSDRGSRRWRRPSCTPS